jgi:hypothetical protein
MVAKITVPNSIKRALNYNEQKLKEGKAECIYAHSFLKEADHLNFYEKLKRFEDLIALNKRATTNTLHVSLNFDPSEKLDKQKLSEIATVYMQKIGFGNQPFLVYHHRDAGHPHIHIVTTNIRKDGTRISIHNIGRNESTQARKQIEEIYKLVKADHQKKQSHIEINPIDVKKIIYGKSETKRGITNVLDAVINRYKYASLTELNAVLRLYNVAADRGKEDGPIFRNRGLVYKILDEKGNKIGVPVKASSIYNKPTLDNLEKIFTHNQILKQEHRRFLKTSIDWILIKPPRNLETFHQALAKEKISLIVRQNDKGVVYGMTYIDHRSKCVFNGSDIGKDYSAKAILEKCGHKQAIGTVKHDLPSQYVITTSPVIKKNIDDQFNTQNPVEKIITAITSADDHPSYLPYDLRKKKRRKRNSN